MMTHFIPSPCIYQSACPPPRLSLCVSGWSDDSGPIVKSAIRYRARPRAERGGGVGEWGGGGGGGRELGRGGWDTENRGGEKQKRL